MDVFKPITKWNHRVTRVEEIPEAVHEAFRHMRTGRPRPVELEIPPDTLANLGMADIIEPEEYPAASASVDDIARAAQMLSEAQRPAIIAGGGSLIAGAGADDRVDFAQLLGAESGVNYHSSVLNSKFLILTTFFLREASTNWNPNPKYSFSLKKFNLSH